MSPFSIPCCSGVKRFDVVSAPTSLVSNDMCEICPTFYLSSLVRQLLTASTRTTRTNSPVFRMFPSDFDVERLPGYGSSSAVSRPFFKLLMDLHTRQTFVFAHFLSDRLTFFRRVTSTKAIGAVCHHCDTKAQPCPSSKGWEKHDRTKSRSNQPRRTHCLQAVRLFSEPHIV